MKDILQILLITVVFISCTSNTIYKKPKDLIPKDTMKLMFTDLLLASSARNYVNKNAQRNIDYTYLLFEKYNIDSARFKRSNIYYTSKVEDYEGLIKEVKKALEVKFKVLDSIEQIKDSINELKMKNKLDSALKASNPKLMP